MPPRQRERDARAGVYLGTRRVGTLGYREGNTWFDYEEQATDHPVLGMAFEVEPERRRTASGRVPEWFANLLPEYGSALRDLIGRDLGKKRVHDFQLLVHLGEDLPGAVRVVAESALDTVEELAEVEHRAHDHALRVSLAGMQLKFSMSFSGKALVIPATGQGGTWIVKVDDPRFPHVPENEHAMLGWARAVGIIVPDHQLVAADAVQGLPRGLVKPATPVLAVRRYDRVEGARVHQEDFAQVREVSPEGKYEGASYDGLARVVASLCPREDLNEYVRRLVACVVMGNLDAHLKNWSFTYPDGRSPCLSPAYDLVSVSSYPEFRTDELAFSLASTRTARQVALKHFVRLAEAAALDAEPILDVVRATVTAMVRTWPEVKREYPVPDFVATHIDERLNTLPLVREAQ